MASSRSGGKSGRSSGLRILWIPGGRKSHPKGRYDSTSKTVTHPNRQRKSQVWSLGGSRAQRDLINAEPDSPSVSGVSSTLGAYATTTLGVAGVAAATSERLPAPPSSGTDTEASATTTDNPNNNNNSEPPTTPNSTASTAPLHSPIAATSEPDLQPSDDTMPAKTTTLPVNTTTTTAEIIDDNRFAALAKQLTDEIDIYDLPLVPKEHDRATNGRQHSPPRNGGSNGNADSSGGLTPTRRKSQHKHNHNNNQQNNVDTIEKLADPTAAQVSGIPSADLAFVDEIQAEVQRAEETLQRDGKHKKKKKSKVLGSAMALDQLDGLGKKSSAGGKSGNGEDDEKMVKCLYYTLMCCDCSVS